MRTAASFQQILESKMKAQSTPQSPENPTHQGFDQYSQQATAHHDPAHLAYLMGQIGQTFFRPTPQQTRKIYPSRPKAPVSEKMAPPHSLSEEQQLANAFFTLQGVMLSPAFPQKELKKAFRALALKLHPDMNKGAISAFIELKNNYETLNRLFN